MLVLGLMILAVFIIDAILKEKYCYNFAFTELDKKGIKLGELSSENKAQNLSPLQMGLDPVQNKWEKFYLDCRNKFQISKINISILRNSYPYYEHFIDW